MSVTQYYKTVTFKSRVSVTVESALIDYILAQGRYARAYAADADTVETMKQNIVRADEALAAIRAGEMFMVDENNAVYVEKYIAKSEGEKP